MIIILSFASDAMGNLRKLCAPLKGHLYTFHIRSTANSPVEVCYSEKKLKHAISFDRLRGTGSGISDSDGTISGRTTSQIVTRKSKPMTPTPLSHTIPPKSPERTGSRSSTSASSHVSPSPRSISSKTSSTSLQSIGNVLQDNTTTTTTPTAAVVSSKRLVRKGLDVSPAMLEFFGMKPITGSNACFQFIEERELPPSKKNKRYGELKESNDLSAAMSGNSGADRSDEMSKSRQVKGYGRYLGEPGPEHLPGVESERGTSDDLYVKDNEGQIMMKKEVELGRMKGSKSKEDMKRLSKNDLSHDKPGPEYFDNTAGDGEDGGNKIEDDDILRKKECTSNSFPILATTSHAVGAVGSNAVRNIAEEGGGIGGGLSTMVTTNATADAMKSSVGVAVAPAATTGVTTPVTVPITGTSMNSGNGSTFGSIFIKGVQIINDDSIYVADVLIQDGIIQELSSKIEEPQGAQIIDGTDKALMPAGIEIHTEFSSPDSVDDFETGSKAALAGGTTTIINVIQPRLNETLLNAYDRLCKVAQSKSSCNVAFSVVISEWNDMIKKEMNTLVHDKGINSFIINIQKDEQLFEIFEYCRSLRVHARILPENKDIIALLENRLRASGINGTKCSQLSRPEALEADMVNHISVLSKLTNCPVTVMSLSSPGAAEVLLRQRSNILIPEIPVTALDAGKSNSALHISWRYAESPSALISCLSSLPLCICISDHCKMRKKDSTTENFGQNAVSSVEEKMSILWAKGVLSGFIDPMRFVAVTSSNAAKVFNLYPKKGKIAVGADADLVLWKLSMDHQTSNLNQHPSLLKGSTAHSKPIMTICGGRIAYNNGKFDLGRGKLMELKSHSPYLYCMLKQVEGVQPNGSTNEGIVSYSHQSHLKENLSNSSRSFPVKNVQRQQFDSVYSATPDDTSNIRASTKVLNPPGGRSTGFW
ncbi:unnamed protein product [Cercopithifilaria johnstoni]|uniref:Amidohydrolase-related domain-containing protein n=1 Tax=Cercopithifilaria johnstoni TaxID=2874296 RepID=A0A8J2Q4W3_9BILA|nr:unnamed protein product [Cercopithifilaria johnstoni]